MEPDTTRMTVPEARAHAGRHYIHTQRLFPWVRATTLLIENDEDPDYGPWAYHVEAWAFTHDTAHRRLRDYLVDIYLNGYSE